MSHVLCRLVLEEGFSDEAIQELERRGHQVVIYAAFCVSHDMEQVKACVGSALGVSHARDSSCQCGLTLIEALTNWCPGVRSRVQPQQGALWARPDHPPAC